MEPNGTHIADHRLFKYEIFRNLNDVYKNHLNFDQRLLAEGEKELSFRQTAFSSFVASTVTSLTVTPFDVVKIRLQAQQKAMENTPVAQSGEIRRPLYLYKNGLMDFLCECNHCKESLVKGGAVSALDGRARTLQAADFKGTVDAFRKIVKFEGFRSLWGGLSPTLIISIPLTIVYFPLYDKIKYNLGYNEKDDKTWYIPPIAGAMCRALMVVCFNPLELFRTKLQSERLTYRQLFEASRTSFSNRGFTFLFSGTVTSLLRDVPFSAIYWLIYEKIKKRLMEERQRSRPQFTDSLVAGAVSGSLAAMVTLPFDVLKTHRQIELGQSGNHGNDRPKSTLKMMTELYERKGIRGLYAGITPRLVKIAPACAIMIGIYEGLKTFFIEYNCQRRISSQNREC